MSQLRNLSYSRLISRTTYYRDKALDLGKQIVSTNEEIGQLKKKLKKIQEEKNQLQDQFDHQSKEISDQYLEQVQKLQEENRELMEQLESGESYQMSEQKVIEQYEKKIEGYERLLNDIQKEITEKEKEADYYKSKVKNLEKRVSYSSSSHMDNDKKADNALSDASDQNQTAVISYFDYIVLWQSEKKIIIRGDFRIKNIGNNTLKNPALCFRFSPPELANMKGKIISIDQASTNKQIAQSHSTDWMFLESEWTKEAKERGEIWVVPTEEMNLAAGEVVSLNEFQILAQMEFEGTFIVEGFVYFRDDSLKMKAANHIMVSS